MSDDVAHVNGNRVRENSTAAFTEYECVKCLSVHLSVDNFRTFPCSPVGGEGYNA